MKKTLSLILALVLTFACAAAFAEPVTLLLMTGSESDPYWKCIFEQIADFNEAYEGKIKIETEFGGSQSADRLEKMKVLNASGQLPAVITQLHEDVGFAQTLAANGRLMDLKPYYDADPEWRKYAMENNVLSSEKLSGEGHLYFRPMVRDSYIGLFYNKEMLGAVGYETVPDNWDEFWTMCDKLVEAGYMPLAMDTLESAWCSMLISTSTIAETAEGRDWIATLYPTDFNNDYMRKAMSTLKRIFDSYTPADSNGAPYAVAANNFLSEQVAMIANGPWMIESMMDPSYCAEDFQYKVGYAPYPGNVMIVENDLIGDEAISVDVTEEEQMAALEWFKFRATEPQIRKECIMRGYSNPMVPLTDEEIGANGQLYIEYNHAVNKVEVAIPCYQTRWDSVTMYEVLATELPNLINDAITVEDMLTKMSESAAQYQKDLADSIQG